MHQRRKNKRFHFSPLFFQHHKGAVCTDATSYHEGMPWAHAERSLIFCEKKSSFTLHAAASLQFRLLSHRIDSVDRVLQVEKNLYNRSVSQVKQISPGLLVYEEGSNRTASLSVPFLISNLLM